MNSEIEAAARRHGLSAGAAETLYQALVAGSGHQAQFSHVELGGMGQWSGGMTQIGAMFDDTLKATVSGFCRDVAPLVQRTAEHGRAGDGRADREGRDGRSLPGGWWPQSLGQPSSSGAQNGIRYACFPEARRLVIERDDRVTVYDTGSRRLTGFAQQQGSHATLAFSGPDGPVAVDDLTITSA